MALIDRIAKSSDALVIPGTGMSGQLPKASPMDEIGVSGLLRTKGVGYVFEEWLRDLSTYRQKQVFREMRDNDAVIGAMFFALEMILRKAEWRVEPAEVDQIKKSAEYDAAGNRNGKSAKGALAKANQYADFESQCLEDMSHTFEDFIAETVSMFVFGFSLSETVYKRRLGPGGRKASKYDDGLIGWRKFAPRAQESILYWIWDDEGGLQGAVQLAAPDYRTVPIPIERLLLFRTTSLKNNPEGRSVLRNAYRCFSDDTEILTRAGWKNGLDVLPTDEVAVLTSQNELAYEVPSEIHRYEYKGDLIRIASRSLDQLVTPNHETWIRKENKTGFERVRADRASVCHRHKRDAIWTQSDADFFSVPAYDVIAHEQNGRINTRERRAVINIPMDDWLAFLGLYVAEGCTTGKRAEISRCVDGRKQAIVTISQNEGEKADAMRKIIAKLPFHVCEHRGVRGDQKYIQFQICDRQLWDCLRHLGKARVKYIPDYVKTCSARQIGLFLSAFHLGDGGFSGGANGYEGTRMYFTSSKRLADDLSELVLKVGGCPSVKRVEREKEIVAGCFSDQPIYKITHGVQSESRPRTISRESYEGLVWCVTTKAGVVYVRRNGKCQWSGNSWFFKRRIEEVEGIGIERDLCGIPVLYASAEAQAAMGGIDACRRLVRNLRVDDQMGVVLPIAYDDNGNPLIKLELMKAAGSKQTDPSATINRYNSDMLNTILAGFIQLGQTPTGSFSLHMSASQIFASAISAFMDSVAAVHNRIAMPRLMKLNKMDLSAAPKLMPGEIGVRDLNDLSTFVQRLAMSGLTFFDKPTADYLRKAARLPAQPDDVASNSPAGAPGRVADPRPGGKTGVPSPRDPEAPESREQALPGASGAPKPPKRPVESAPPEDDAEAKARV